MTGQEYGAATWSVRMAQLAGMVSQALRSGQHTFAEALAEACWTGGTVTSAVLVPEGDRFRVAAARGIVADRLRAGPAVAGVSEIGAGSIASVPVLCATRHWGTLVLISPSADGIPQDDIDGLRSVAAWAGLSLEQADLQARSEQHVRHLQALHEVSRHLTSALDTTTILTLIVDVATGLFDLDLCCVLLASPEGNLGVRAARGLRAERAASLVVPPGEVPGPSHFGLDRCAGVASIAITGRSAGLGFLVALRQQPFSLRELNLLSTWASLAGVALENSHLMAEMESTHKEIMGLLISALEERIGKPAGYSARVAELAAATARRLGLAEAEVRDCELAALFHNVWPVLQPTENSTTWAKVAAMMQQARLQEYGAAPGEDPSSVGARILTVASAYVFLQGSSSPFTQFAPLLELKAGAGAAYDPKVVAALESVILSRLGLQAQVLPPAPIPVAAASQAEPVRPAAVRGEIGVLTEREQEILTLVSRGLSNREIAALLYLSEATVKTHVSRILQKLGVPDRTKAAVYALQQAAPAVP